MKAKVESITVESHVKEVKEEFHKKMSVILEAIGLEAEGNAITEITNMEAVDTGRLRNSITFVTRDHKGTPNTQPGAPAEKDDYKPLAKAQDGEVCIGTNVEYAPYIELGTYRMGKRPFLGNAISNHLKEYERIMKQGLEED